MTRGVRLVCLTELCNGLLIRIVVLLTFQRRLVHQQLWHESETPRAYAQYDKAQDRQGGPDVMMRDDHWLNLSDHRP